MSVTTPLEKIPVQKQSLPESEYLTNCIALGVKKPNRAVAILAASATITDSTSVDLSPNFIGGLGLQALTSVLYKNKKLASLNLSSNGLSNESVVFFCREFVDHPGLKVLNLSGNPLTLPAGEALLQLVQRNHIIEEVLLSDTAVDDAVQRSIKRTLNLRKQQSCGTDSSGKKKVAPTSINAMSTPYQRILQEHLPKREAKKAELAAASSKREQEALAALRETCSVGKPQLPPADPVSGWTVVNVAVLAFPTTFYSETNVILNDIIPALNRQYAPDKLYFNALDQLPQEEAGKGVHVTKKVVAEDYIADVRKSGGIVVELLGDRIGFVELTPALRPAGAPPANPLNPIQYTLHDAAWKRRDNVIVLSCIRKTARQLDLPAALTPIFSDEPALVHPDAQAGLVKAAVAKSRGVDHKLAGFDIDVARRSWERHSAFLEAVKKETPEAQLVDRYEAEYDTSDAKGRVYLKGLDGFKDRLKSRFAIIAEALVKQRRSNAQPPNPWDSRFAAITSRAAEVSTIRKAVLGKLDLYTVTPSSRNMFLLHGAGGVSLSTIFSAYLHRAMKKQQYVVASHFVRNPALADEPSDLRTLFLSLMRQLSVDKSVLKYIASEVDIVRVHQVFVETVSRFAGTLEDGKVLVLAIDGLSDLDDAVFPCENLRKTDTGADIWAPSMLVGGNKTSPATNAADGDDASAVPLQTKLKSNDISDKLSFIPNCLPRNVRVVGTAVTGSPAHEHLESRGRDSTEPLHIGDLSANEMDLVVQFECQRLGIAVTEDDLCSVRSKNGAVSPEYLAFVVNGLRGLTETPDYLSPGALVAAFPPTLPLCCDQLLGQLEATFGASFVRTSLGAIMFSRWGFCEMDLRDLLSHSADAKKLRIPSVDVNKLLRMLRPALLQLPAESTSSTNAMLDIVYLRSRAFAQAAKARYFSQQEQVAFVHQQLAHHYRRIAALVDHPLCRTALKEFPYHAVCAKMWNVLADTVFSLEYVSRCYRHDLGYPLLRECIRAYNALDADIASGAVKRNDALTDKMKQYVLFIRDHNINLVQFPHLVAQIAIGTAATSQVHADAIGYFKANPKVPHIVLAGKSASSTSGKLHRERVTDAQFAPNGMRFATCSDDRSIRIATVLGEPIQQICQSASRLKMIKYSLTSRYLLAVSEDRVTFVFDATNGQLVSKGSGHFATIRAADLSVRGKFYATGSDDRTMKVFETETGALLASANHAHFSSPTSSTGYVSQVVAHPLAEDTFFTACDKKILGWKLTHLRDACEEILSIQAHHTLPLSSLALVMDGSYIIACVSDPPLPSDGASSVTVVRVEENIKVWSASNGRHIASLGRGTLSSTVGPQFLAVSPNERRVAAALVDGSIQVYDMDWRSCSVLAAAESAVPELIQPYLHLRAYQRHSNPLASLLRFSHDSALLVGVGNLRQLKVWVVDDQAGYDGVPGSAEETYAEYLSDQCITALAVTSNPQEEGGTMVVGEITGRVLTLRVQNSEVQSQVAVQL